VILRALSMHRWRAVRIVPEASGPIFKWLALKIPAGAGLL